METRVTKISEHEPKSFGSLLAFVEKFQNSRTTSWYRGTGDENHALLPTLMRRSPVSTPEELSNIERRIANSFAQRAPPFITFDFSSEWRTLFYMQHYGIPTRLLDWTESPFVGLYFALTSVKRSDGGEPLADAALWLCDPVAWNKSALSHITFTGGVLDENCEEIKAYSPSMAIDQRASVPVMILGTHNSPRIVAQRGVFALFGKGAEGMEETFSKGSFSAGSMAKIIIKREYVNVILESLHRKGFAESTVYPDLVGLALEIRRIHGYH